MSEIFSVQLTAAATLALAVFAFLTAWLAFLAWRKQSREVSDQAAMLELQRQQLEAQREDSARQAGVLELQTADLRESLGEREREAEDRRRNQAMGVTAWLEQFEGTEFGDLWGTVVSNQSGQPIYDVHAYLYYMEEHRLGAEWAPTTGGASQVIKVVMPHVDLSVILPREASPYPEEDSGRAYRPGLMFTDAYGNRWERDPRGVLSPVPSDAAYARNPSEAGKLPAPAAGQVLGPQDLPHDSPDAAREPPAAD